MFFRKKKTNPANTAKNQDQKRQYTSEDQQWEIMVNRIIAEYTTQMIKRGHNGILSKELLAAIKALNQLKSTMNQIYARP